MQKKVVLFGESEKGKYQFPYLCNTLFQLADTFGHPPEDSLGLFFAIQALMYERQVYFFRVKEEGFSIDDYLAGINFLKNKSKVKNLDAICLPNVGSTEIINATDDVSKIYNSIIVTTEKDLYDYLTSF